MATPSPLEPTAAAAQVVTNAELFRAVCAFLPGPPTWLAEMVRMHGPVNKEVALVLDAKKRSGTPGLLPYLAIQRHDLRTLERLYWLHKQPQCRKNPRFWFHSAMHDAATLGNLEALEWLHATTGEVCEPLALSLAAKQGFVDVVRWLLNHFPLNNTASAQQAMATAAAHGHLDLIKTFHAWRADVCTPEMMDLAAEHGHLEVVQFLHAHGGKGCTTAAVDRAAENGHVKIVKWLLDHRVGDFTEAAMRFAVANSHLDVAQVLWEKRNDADNVVKLKNGMRVGVAEAFRNEDIPMIAYLVETAGQDILPVYALSIPVQWRQDIPLSGRGEECVHHGPDFVQFLLKTCTFSVDQLTEALGRAKLVRSNEVQETNVRALETAIAQKQTTVSDENTFVPSTETKDNVASIQRVDDLTFGIDQITKNNDDSDRNLPSLWNVQKDQATSTPQRNKAKAKRAVRRSRVQPHTQTFLFPSPPEKEGVQLIYETHGAGE